MMAIRVQYRSATNSRGAKLHVTNGEKQMTVAYAYGDDDHEKLEAAKAFVKKFMPYAPEIDPEPCTFKGDNFYRFGTRKVDNKKLEDLIFQFGLDRGITNGLTLKMIEDFVKQNRELL